MIEKSYDKILFKNAESPLFCTLRQVSADCAVNELTRWHEEIEFKIFRKGRAVINISGTEIEAEKNDIVVINPYEPHHNVHFYEDTEYDLLIINLKTLQNKFNLSSGKPFLKGLIDGTTQLQRVIKKDLNIVPSADMLVKESLSDFNKRELAIVCASAYFLNTLLESFSISPQSPESIKKISDLKRLEPLLKYIKEHLSEDLSLDKLASIAGFSPKYLSWLFKNVVRINLHNYIDRLKLSKAQLLLSTTEKKISDISLELGFSYESYFVKWFKKITDTTPSEFRSIK